MTHLRLFTFVAAAVLCAAGGTPLVHASPVAPASTWFVLAQSPPGGNGSEAAPFATLAQAETASAAGDTIVVIPAAAGVPALDGGIALKPQQKLIGAGAPVLGAPTGAALPRVTNRGFGHDGDAIKLATEAEVRNIVVDGANRGGIYGLDAVDVTVSGNDVSGTNRLCHDGFIIGPFQIPLNIALGVALPALPNFVTLNNGWAAVMTDHHTGSGNVVIENNLVHDTACGDGIDVRTFGTAAITAALRDNTIHTVNVGVAKLSVLALGLQSSDNARLNATLTGNTQRDIATAAAHPFNHFADSEGVFLNPSGRSHMNVTIDRNTFQNGGGNFSANGLEYVTTSGAPNSVVTVTNSTFDNVTGDIIENYNLSTDAAHQSLTLDNVRATKSHFPGAVLNPLVPANLGTCLVTTVFGRAATTDLVVRNSDLHDCSADGISFVSHIPTGPEPATAQLRFDISDTNISGTAAHGINIVNIGDLAMLHGKVEDTSVSASAGALVRTSNRNGAIGDAVLDFGGGALGSTGHNCFANHGGPAVELSGIAVTARSAWWGEPHPSRIHADNAALDANVPLASAADAACHVP